MIKLESKEYLDLNFIGLMVSILILTCILSINIDIFLKLFSCFYVLLFDLWLVKQIKQNQNIDVILTSKGNWQLKSDNKLNEVELKDFWKLRGFACLWLKGEGESLSILVSRSIIGIDKFSRLNIQIK